MYKPSIFTYWWWKDCDDFRNITEKWIKQNNTQSTRVTTSITNLSFGRISCKVELSWHSALKVENLHAKELMHRKHILKTATCHNHNNTKFFLFPKKKKNNSNNNCKRHETTILCSGILVSTCWLLWHIQMFLNCSVATGSQHTTHAMILFKTPQISHFFKMFLCHFKYKYD